MWICWLIWRSRCKTAFEQTTPNPKVVTDEGRKLQEEHNQLPKKKNSRPEQRQVQRRWEKPERDEIAINVDATWCQRTRAGGIGVVARNSNGILVGGTNCNTTGDNVDNLEAQAIHLGITLAKDRG